MISGIDYHLGTVEPGEQRSAELSCGALGFAVNCAQRCVCVMFAEETFSRLPQTIRNALGKI